MKSNPYNSPNFKKKPLIISIVFLLFSCLAFFFLYKEINNNKKIEELAQTEWQNEANRREGIKLLDRSIKTISEERASLESHFAQSSDVVPFLDTLEKLAFSVGAKHEVVSVDISEDKTGLSVGLKASGSFEVIYKFLTLLENSPYELEFTSVDIQKLETQTISAKKVVVPQWGAVFKIKLLSFVL
ncbi:MAG: hypothetical protein WC870_01010 [Candidatus Paceibacterota bacterium]